MCQLAMLIFGIIALASGKFSLSRNRVVRGASARIIGVVLIVPLPLAFFVGLIVGAMKAARGEAIDIKTLGPLNLIDAGISLVCLIIAVALAVAWARPAWEPPPLPPDPATSQPPSPREIDPDNPYQPPGSGY